MESEKVKKTKKALKCCSSPSCTSDCPLSGYHSDDYKTLCRDKLIKDCLTLIDDLESENERLNNELKKHKCDWLNSEKMHLQAEMEETEFELLCTNKLLKDLREENQKLKDRIAELKNQMCRNEDLHNAIKKLNDILKEFIGE